MPADKIGVKSTFAQQLRMSPSLKREENVIRYVMNLHLRVEARPASNTRLPNLNDAALVHDADEVGPLNGAEPVGYDEHGAVPCGSVQCLLHHPL